MSFSYTSMLLLYFLLLVKLAEIASSTPLVATTLAKPGCPISCGNIAIPYPFGTRQDCYHDKSFLVTCDSNKLFLRKTAIRVLNISVLDSDLRISSWVAHDCYDQSGRLIRRNDPWIRTPKFPISHTKNMFIVIGCDSYAYVKGSLGVKYSTGCMSLCDTVDDVNNGSCSGIGCCQTTIPEGVIDFNLTARSFNNHTHIASFNPCSFAFVVENGLYNFSIVDLLNLKDIEMMPVVLEWAIPSETCAEAITNVTSYACGKNSICNDTNFNGKGYRCNCSQGYQGNPYLPDGCQDINECLSPELNPCTNVSSKNVCHNTNGNFTCSCPKGYHGDGRKDGRGCISNKLWLKIIIGIGIAILALLVVCSLLYLVIQRRRKLIKQREKLFQQNGGLIIKEKLSGIDGSVEKAKIYTIEELKKATNNFDDGEIIGRGGFGTVYKGILPKNKIVAIKMSTTVDRSQIEQFVNEVVVLSQINHRNVVKLLGCCLETKVPLLIYEFINNGTLFHHLHVVGHASSISWEVRLRIAKETAGALSYLHSAASTPIIHRDVKSTNILLDENFTAKVSDFGASKLVPSNKTQFTTMVQGTMGYLDPEYFHTNQLSEKSDVYSFGVILVELLTSRVAVSFSKPEKEINLAPYFISLMKENRLSLILDERILNGGNTDQVQKVANIAQNCLKLKGDERPTMREVAMELEGLVRVEKQLWASSEVNPGEAKCLTGESFDLGSTSITAGYDSSRNQAIMPLGLDGGR